MDGLRSLSLAEAGEHVLLALSSGSRPPDDATLRALVSVFGAAAATLALRLVDRRLVEQWEGEGAAGAARVAFVTVADREVGRAFCALGAVPFCSCGHKGAVPCGHRLAGLVAQALGEARIVHKGGAEWGRSVETFFE